MKTLGWLIERLWTPRATRPGRQPVRLVPEPGWRERLAWIAGAAAGGFMVAVTIMWAVFVRPEAAPAVVGMALMPSPASLMTQAAAAPANTTAPLGAAAPVPTGAPVATVVPTATPVPTVTPVPPPTPVPNTKPGTVLAFGQEWYQDGVGMSLKRPIWKDSDAAVMCPDLLSFQADLANKTPTDLLANIDSSEWYAQDNRGVRYPIKLAVPLFGCEDWTADILRANQVIFPNWANSGANSFVVTGKFENLPTLQWLRVVIPRASRINDAAWQIDVVK